MMSTNDSLTHPSEEDCKTPPVLVSACLAGVPCRYDGAAKPDPAIISMVEAGRAIPVCAESAGGLPTPRPPAEIRGGDGTAVLSGVARVVTVDGEDVTDAFVEGARAVASLARERGARSAILQDKSPSCGARRIYDGTHHGRLVEGQGVLAAVLTAQGIAVEPHRTR